MPQFAYGLRYMFSHEAFIGRSGYSVLGKQEFYVSSKSTFLEASRRGSRSWVEGFFEAD